MNLRPRILASLFLAAVTGCANQDQVDAQNAVTAYHYGAYAEAQRLLIPIAKKTNEDFALNNCRLGSSSLAMYDLLQSQSAFLQAYEVLNSFGVNNGGRTAGAILVDEKIKIWRGEPFERAMANYYLGLTYYMQGDYNNARGAFENALFKLRDYQTDDANADPKADKYREVESTFALGQYLLARCYQRIGDDQLATANFQKLTKLRPELAPMADIDRNRVSNVLLVIDYGQGPHKATNGDGSIVGFLPTPREAGPIPEPFLSIDGRGIDTRGLDAPLVDLVSLAQDRRWQSIDTIRTIKSVVGTGLIAAGAYEGLSGNRPQNAEIGLGLIAAGLLLKASSQADTRVWEMLPRATFAIPLTLPPGTHDITVNFAGWISQTWHGLVVPATGEATYYFRVQQTPAAGAYTWPPATLTGWPTPAAPAPAPVVAPAPVAAPNQTPPPVPTPQPGFEPTTPP